MDPPVDIMDTPIQGFYRGTNVFITGVTGFIGKYILEKLLRSCPGVNQVYILLRPKKNKQADERLKTLLSDPIFETLRLESPNFHRKIVVVAGDLSHANLGISTEEETHLINNVNIVFHSGATVRFDEALPYAVKTNIEGSKNTLLLAQKMHNLKSFIYVSTAYSNCNQEEIRETIYTPGMTCENLIQCVNALDEDICVKITPSLIKDWPNAYTFTKSVAEDCVRQYGKEFPVGIVRPSIVTPSLREPVPGYVDNINGLNGYGFGIINGLLHVGPTCGSKTVELVPIDLLGNFILAAAWDQANRDTTNVKVYNFVSGPRNPISNDLLAKATVASCRKYPTLNARGYYFLMLIPNVLLFKIVALFLHMIPGFFMDLGLKLSGHKTMAISTYNKLHKFMIVVSYFSTNEWRFEEANTLSVMQKMNAADRKLFDTDIKQVQWDAYIEHTVLGIRKFLCKDDISTVVAAREKLQKLKMIHYTIVFSLCLFVIYLICKMFNLM